MPAFNLQGAGGRRLFRELQRMPGLVGLWPLNEQSGTTVYDRGPNRLNGTISGSPGYSRPIKSYENARQFTAASSEYFAIADNASLSTGDIDFTIAGWFYATTLAADHGLASKGVPGAREWRIIYASGSSRFQFYVSGDGTNESGLNASSLGAPATGTWYFIVAWNDSTANTINIQVNGGTVDSAAHTTGGFNSTTAFELGRQDAGSYWNGRIGPVGFWKRVLTSAERTALYRGPRWGTAYSQLTDALKAGLISYWNLNEASGNAIDSHGANTLTDNNTVTSNPGVLLLEPYDHYGLSFRSASSQYITMGDVDAADFDFRSPFSGLALVVPQAASADDYIISKCNNSAVGWRWYIRDTNLIYAQLVQPSSANLERRSTATVVQGTAYLLGFSYDGSASASGLLLYRNGVRETEVTVTDTLTGPIANSSPLNIGAGNNAGAFFEGDIGVCALFNRALSAVEHKTLAAAAGFL